MQQESADKVVHYRLKNGMIATLTGIESEPYQTWVFNNLDSRYRLSDGAKLHCLTQMMQGNDGVAESPNQQTRSHGKANANSHSV